MNTYNDGEATSLDSQNLPQNTVTPPPYNPVPQVPADEKKNNLARNIAVGAGGAILLGGTAIGLMSMKSADDDDANKSEVHPAWVDDDVPVAHNVTDDMSFNEAFAAAREEVGPGGCFEWHGGVYGTFTAKEWNAMSAAEKAEWGDHFDWNHFDTDYSHMAHNTTHTAQPQAHHEVHNEAHHEVNHTTTEVYNTEIHETHYHVHNDAPQQQATQVVSEEPTVEVLGVVHDDESGYNYGAMTVDGEGVVLVDVDNNLKFDYMMADKNHNGELDQDEIHDIREDNITVADLGGFRDAGMGAATAGEQTVDGPTIEVSEVNGSEVEAGPAVETQDNIIEVSLPVDGMPDTSAAGADQIYVEQSFDAVEQPPVEQPAVDPVVDQFAQVDVNPVDPAADMMADPGMIDDPMSC